MTYETTTATITSGVRAIASACRKMATTSTDVSGKPNMATVIAPMPIATPAIIGRPGRWERAMPPTAPMYMLGKIGPPRKALSEAP